MLSRFSNLYISLEYMKIWENGTLLPGLSPSNNLGNCSNVAITFSHLTSFMLCQKSTARTSGSNFELFFFKLQMWLCPWKNLGNWSNFTITFSQLTSFYVMSEPLNDRLPKPSPKARVFQTSATELYFWKFSPKPKV